MHLIQKNPKIEVTVQHTREASNTTMHDWNHDGKIDLNDHFLQDELESRNTGTGTGGGSASGSGSGSGAMGGASSGGCCIFIL